MNTISDNEAYDLAILAAQLMCRQRTPADAVEAAWAIIEKAKDKLEGVRLRAKAQSPEAQAEWGKQKAERLEGVRCDYAGGVKYITSQSRKGRADELFTQFLIDKGKREGGSPVWFKGMLATYRQRGFNGTELEKLKAEFERWRGKGRQGRVLKRATDGRLRENRQKKKERQAKEAFANLTKPKLGPEAVLPFVNRGRKTPIYRVT